MYESILTSEALAPRDKSLTGFFKPKITGPIA